MKRGARTFTPVASETDRIGDPDPVQGLAPVLPRLPRLLILGSMPGKVSLEQQQYYAHPRNAFWPIMAALLGDTPGMSYVQRCRMLEEGGIAVWDVLGSCQRQGSLDADIVPGSERINDIPALAGRHPGLRAIALNGGKAHALYRRHVQNRMPSPLPALRLPSTSPAHASMTMADKMKIWLEALMPYRDE